VSRLATIGSYGYNERRVIAAIQRAGGTTQRIRGQRLLLEVCSHSAHACIVCTCFVVVAQRSILLASAATYFAGPALGGMPSLNGVGGAVGTQAVVLRVG
jgi:hypothetical protein